MDGWMGGWMNGCVGGWMDGWVDGWMGGYYYQTAVCILPDLSTVHSRRCENAKSRTPQGVVIVSFKVLRYML